MRVLFLHRYGTQAASYRYRFAQYFADLKKNDFIVEEHSFFSDDYLNKKFSGQRFVIFQILGAFLRRLYYLMFTKAPDAMVLYKDVLPYLPFFFEYYLILRRVPYITDFDDAIYLNYEKSKNLLVRLLLKNKFKKIFKNAKFNFAGNANLAEYAMRENSNTVVLPTVVDLNYYVKTKDFSQSHGPLVIGWIGSPSTAQSLQAIKRALKIIQTQYQIKICLVGSGPIDLGLENIEIRNWSLQREIDDLLSFDIGIMPLEDDEWSRGKCGFKLIQYMACGLPVVGSPVGVNSSIVDHGKNGFLANSIEEWVHSLSQLIESQEKRILFGREARQKVLNHYCLEKTTPLFLKYLKKIEQNNYAKNEKI